jgi:hypothetical protein
MLLPQCGTGCHEQSVHASVISGINTEQNVGAVRLVIDNCQNSLEKKPTISFAGMLRRLDMSYVEQAGDSAIGF